MENRAWRILLVPALSLLLGLGILSLLPAHHLSTALAQAGSGVLRVASTGDDTSGCGSASTPCQTIQFAVHEAGEGDEIRIAAGTYAGSQQVYAMGAGQMTTMTQVVIVTKSLTLRGGYTIGDWDTSDPASNPTVIDAEGFGRGITIVGDGAQTVTVEGLTITGGDYTGLGSSYADGQCLTSSGDCGGGIYAYQAVVIVRRAIITDNVASTSSSSSHGGGIYLYEVPAGSRVEDSTLANNRSFGTNSCGGAVGIHDSGALTVSNCTLVANRAADNGGAINSSPGTGQGLFIEASDFISNSVLRTANGQGGAVYVNLGQAYIRASTFVSNTGRNGGALTTEPGNDQEIVVDRNVFHHNWASAAGGAVYIGYGSVATLTNNMIVQNESAGLGSGAVVEGTYCGLSHNTFAGEPSGSEGDAVFVRVGGTVAELRNNIVASYTKGIRTNPGVSVTADHTLFFGNQENTYLADDTFTCTNEITGQAPVFVDPAALDYHVGDGSPAIDAGVDAGVTGDFDGHPRPLGGGFDIGADEYWPATLVPSAFLPLVVR
jgi:hypothetical protein